MKVLLLVHGLPIGGTETMVCHLARRLRLEGVDVAIGCLDLVGDLGAGLAAEGFAVELYSRRPGLDLTLPWRIASSVRKGKFDLVHAHQYTCFFYGVMAKFWCWTPLIFTEHGRFYPDLPSWKRRAFNVLFARAADAVTAVSQGVRRSLHEVESFPAATVQVVYNGVDLSTFRPTSSAGKAQARSLLGLSPSAPVVGTVGRLDSIKNYALLLAAFELASRNVREAVLAFVGEGPELPRLTAVAATLGLKGRVRFLGKRRDLPQVFPAFDVFALSSFSEGTPMTCLEAMAAGVPIVATAVGGIPEILADGSEALLVPGIPPRIEDPATLLASEHTRRYAATLEQVLTDTSLRGRLAQNALDRARRDFSLEVIGEQYMSLYRRIAPVPDSSRILNAEKA